jgi:NDP-sugar pyrophosphorylase family protein
MALLPSVIPGESSVFHQNGAINGISKIPVNNGSQAGNFACVQILSPEFLKLLPENGTFDIISKGYLPALQRGMTICASIHDGYWFDLGTPETYWAAIHQLLKRSALVEAMGIQACRALHGRATTLTQDGVFIDSLSTVDGTATIGPSVVVESNCSISANAQVSESVLLPGASVAPGEVIHQMIVGPKIRHQLSVSV